MEPITYLGLSCYRLTNGEIEVIVGAEMGPRVLRYGFVGGPNLLGEFPELSATTEYGEWRPYGGHRLWVAPEAMPQSYAPDDTPVEARFEGIHSVRLIAPVDKAGFEKEILVTLAPSGTKVDLVHRITNRTSATVTAAPWVLTIMSDGEAVLPLEPHRNHGDVFLPSQPLILWPFTDLADPRVVLTKKTVRLVSDANKTEPQKLGLMNKQGWAAYLKGDTIFVKTFPYLEGSTYPDYGCNCELFTKGTFLEVESLGPLVRLAPGESACHQESWRSQAGLNANGLAAEIEKMLPH